MARFKYMGEAPNKFIAQQGPCLQIKVPLQDGSRLVLTAADQSAGFLVGQDIGHDFTDARSLRYLRADSRFQEI